LGTAMANLKDKGYIINNPSGPFSSSMWDYIGPEVCLFHILYPMM
jgi:DEAD/DEAH box helicase domain-containing protein